jgi:hypothetical protein
MATPDRETIRRRREEQMVRAYAAIERSFGHRMSNRGVRSTVARGARQKQDSPSRRGEKR